jgi:hypothetical protein
MPNTLKVRLLQHKMISRTKNIFIFLLTENSSLIFEKIVYDFESRKPFFDFEHLILKSTDPAKTRPRPHQDLLGTCLSPHPGLDQDPPWTCPIPRWDPPET